MWPAVSYETCAWERDLDALASIPKSRRSKILPTYEAAVPAEIATLPVSLPAALQQRIAEVEVTLARFDQAQESRPYSLPALLLRSESSSSSQIERLTSSVRNVALAELTPKAPANALLIAGNVAAMREAAALQGPLSIPEVCSVHRAIMRPAGYEGGIRNQQVWIGGTPYSPHGAIFVPPHEGRVGAALEDLIAFSGRTDVSPVAKAAIFHAQFETIHPFTDGNGRTGRALLHRMLAADDLLRHSTVPVSAGLLHDTGSYMEAIGRYHEGDIEAIVKCTADALELAVVVGDRIGGEMDAVLARWQAANDDRAGAASHRLAALLVQQPVVSVAYVAERLGITDRAARNLVDVACKRGILAKMGNAKRGAFYQASEILAVLEEASSLPGIRRMAVR